MQDCDESIFEAFKAARRNAGLGQGALAGMAGCTQSAVSMFERGSARALSKENVAKIAEILGVDMAKFAARQNPSRTPDAETPPAAAAGKPEALFYCPDCECPASVPYLVGGRLVFLPKLRQNGKFCAYCGEVLETRCPGCGGALNEGAFCTMCGAEYIAPLELAPGADPADYIAARAKFSI